MPGGGSDVALWDRVRNIPKKIIFTWLARYVAPLFAAFIVVAWWRGWLPWHEAGLLINAALVGSTLYLMHLRREGASDRNE
jgi:hypothetical protein